MPTNQARLSALISSAQTQSPSSTVTTQSRGRRKTQLHEIGNWCQLAEQAGFKPAALGGLVGVSLRSLELFFHARTGRTVRDWLNELRLRIATQRLLAGATIDNIVSDLGWCNRSHFHRQFRTLYRRTPADLLKEWNRKNVAPIQKKRSGSIPTRPYQEIADALGFLEAQVRYQKSKVSPGAGNCVRIALVDDNPHTHDTIAEAFNVLRPDWHFASYPVSDDLIPRLTEASPNTVLLGCHEAQRQRFFHLHKLAICMPCVPVIVLAGTADRADVLAALAGGAAGYVLKTGPTYEIVRGVQEVLREGTHLCYEARLAVMDFFHGKMHRSPGKQLTARERQVCVLRAAGRTEKDIALQLSLETKTVSTLAQSSFKKLGIHRSSDLLGALAATRQDL